MPFDAAVFASPPPASPLLEAAFFLLSILVAGLFVLACGRAWAAEGKRRKAMTFAVLGSIAWMGSWAALAQSGVLSRMDLRPPPYLFVMVGAIVCGLSLGLGPIGRRLAGALPLTALLAVQAFRLPLELVMHQAARAGVMPVELSFSGYNFDIVTGASAVVLATLGALDRLPRWAVWAWNIVGIAALATIAVAAALLSPLVRAFGEDPRHVNTWVMFTPYVWLPTVLVSVAVLGHVVLTRQLLTSSACDHSSCGLRERASAARGS